MKWHITLFFLLCSFFSLAQTSNLFAGFEIPEIKQGDYVIHHTGYSLLYNEAYEQADWVAYELTSAETNNQYERSNRFLMDPAVSTSTADDADYRGSGYDRGHLAPAADMGWSEVSEQESFYYSNMSPQLPGFNRGIWKQLETFVRNNAIAKGFVYVVTGPVLTAGLPVIGHNKVAVPSMFYKVCLIVEENRKVGIGFMIPNQSSRLPVYAFATTIDEVEKRTGINFFPTLSEVEEKIAEHQYDVQDWSWSKSTHSESPNSKTRKTGGSVQCVGMTQKGARCKKRTTNENGKCYLHQNQ